jgi:catechol 2,3-dioxygenase-like lactoylglutathione lyase family enzyme
VTDELVNVRYMADDVQEAVAFYTTHFGFTVRSNYAPAFADVVRGHLRPLLSGPTSSSGSMRASTRRTVASPGGCQAPVHGSRRVPSAARTWPGASLAHSPMAARDLAPTSTAQTATPSTPTSGCRRPRRWRGSVIWARESSRLRHWSGASAAGAASRWVTAGMGDDEQAGTAVRSGHGLGYPHDRREPCLLHIHPAY